MIHTRAAAVELVDTHGRRWHASVLDVRDGETAPQAFIREFGARAHNEAIDLDHAWVPCATSTEGGETPLVAFRAIVAISAVRAPHPAEA